MSIKTACGWCGEIFEAHRFNALYCSNAHRTAAYRARRKDRPAADGPQVPNSPPSRPGVSPDEWPVTTATIAELTATSKEGTALGLAAIALASRVDQGAAEGGAAFAALVRQHGRTLDLARDQKAGAAGDLADELERRRQERRDREDAAR